MNAQNGDGVTPLHDAVQRKEPEIVRLLVNNNADPTLAAFSGYVCLSHKSYYSRL